MMDRMLESNQTKLFRGLEEVEILTMIFQSNVCSCFRCSLYFSVTIDLFFRFAVSDLFFLDILDKLYPHHLNLDLFPFLVQTRSLCDHARHIYYKFRSGGSLSYSTVSSSTINSSQQVLPSSYVFISFYLIKYIQREVQIRTINISRTQLFHGEYYTFSS